MKNIFSAQNAWPLFAMLVIGSICVLHGQSHEFKKTQAFSEDLFYYPLVETIEQAGEHKGAQVSLRTEAGAEIIYLGAWNLKECEECLNNNLTVPTDDKGYPEYALQNISKPHISYEEFIMRMVQSNAQNEGEDLLGHRWRWYVPGENQIVWDLYECSDGTCYLTFKDVDGEVYQQKLKYGA